MSARSSLVQSHTQVTMRDTQRRSRLQCALSCFNTCYRADYARVDNLHKEDMGAVFCEYSRKVFT